MRLICVVFREISSLEMFPITAITATINSWWYQHDVMWVNTRQVTSVMHALLVVASDGRTGGQRGHASHFSKVPILAPLFALESAKTCYFEIEKSSKNSSRHSILWPSAFDLPPSPALWNNFHCHWWLQDITSAHILSMESNQNV